MKFTTKTPHVEQDWAADFVLALRLRDVPGAAIGAALAEVDAHCADAGEGARGVRRPDGLRRQPRILRSR